MKKLSMNYLRENKGTVISVFMLAAVYILLLVFTDIRMPYLIDSDMSSEMVLGSVLKDENRIMTDSWFYSTELRVINTQLIYSFFFRFTDSWHTVRLLSNAVLYIILILSTVYLCRKTGIRKYQFAVSSFLLLSFSIVYFYIMIMGCYYIPHIAAEFLFLGLCMAYMNSSGKRKYSALIISSLIALLTGMGGLRQLAISYLPFMAGVCVMLLIIFFRDGWEMCRKSDAFKVLPIGLISTFAAVCGFLVNNKILSKKYHFMSYNGIKFTSIKTERIQLLLNDILVTFGYKTAGISASSLICNCSCAVMIILTVYSVITGLGKNAGKEYRIMTVFFISSLSFFILLYAMTDMSYAERYNYPVLVWVFPLISCAFREGSFGKAPECTGKVFAVVFALMVAGRSFILMNEIKDVNRTRTLNQVAEYLSGTDYEQGYATFWNSNVLTELSDGKLEMYSWKSDLNNTQSPDEMMEWLQKTDHTVSHPDGKVFMLYKKEKELENCVWKEKLQDENKIFSTEEYVVYGYESYDAMKKILG